VLRDFGTGRPRFPPIGEPSERLLTVAEVASRLSVSTATVYKLCERGELRSVRISNAIRVLPHDLESFLSR
jgi:excisionase family DNA binding protein